MREDTSPAPATTRRPGIDDPRGPTTEAPTVDTALGHAARLLLAAEMTTDLTLMDRLVSTADSWTMIARTLAERDH